MNFHQSILIRSDHRQNGASLIMVMMILIVVSLLGVSGAQIGLMSERGARNDRDIQMAWQAAEAALIDAEFDMTCLMGKTGLHFFRVAAHRAHRWAFAR